MRQENPKRIAIIGLPGSGKSTFAIKLGKLLNIPVHHLDRHMFDGRKKREKTDFIALKESILKEDAWIIEGCSFSTLEMHFARADTVIYFDLPRMLCIWRVCKRFFAFDQHLSKTGCLDGVNWTLIKYIWNFNRDKRQGIEYNDHSSRRGLDDNAIIMKDSIDKTHKDAAAFVVSNLILAYGLMKTLGIQKVEYVGTPGANAIGTLLSPKYWKDVEASK